MSVDHKRPLVAFAVVTVACIVILANAVRSEAFVSALRSEASHVVSGLSLAPADHGAGRPERTPEAVPLVDAPRVAPVQRAQRPAPAALHGVLPRGHREHAHLAGSDHAHAQHAGRHAGDQNGHRAHGAGQAHGQHRGHGNHPGADHHAGRQGDRGPANAPGRGQPQSARQHR